MLPIYGLLLSLLNRMPALLGVLLMLLSAVSALWGYLRLPYIYSSLPLTVGAFAVAVVVAGTIGWQVPQNAKAKVTAVLMMPVFAYYAVPGFFSLADWRAELLVSYAWFAAAYLLGWLATAGVDRLEAWGWGRVSQLVKQLAAVGRFAQAHDFAHAAGAHESTLVALHFEAGDYKALMTGPAVVLPYDVTPQLIGLFGLGQFDAIVAYVEKRHPYWQTWAPKEVLDRLKPIMTFMLHLCLRGGLGLPRDATRASELKEVLMAHLTNYPAAAFAFDPEFKNYKLQDLFLHLSNPLYVPIPVAALRSAGVQGSLWDRLFIRGAI